MEEIGIPILAGDGQAGSILSTIPTTQVEEEQTTSNEEAENLLGDFVANFTSLYYDLDAGRS